jgi:hypothetical protein
MMGYGYYAEMMGGRSVSADLVASASARSAQTWSAPEAYLGVASFTAAPGPAVCMNRSATRLDWRGAAIVAIKAVHSVIFVLNATSVVHIFWVGVLNRRSRWTRLALIAALGESIVFVVNRGRCPLTQIVEALGADSGRVSDMFLPRWFADRIPQLFGPPLVIGLLALAYHRGFAPRQAAHCQRVSAPLAECTDRGS